jgi:hypothetical protein
MEQTLRSWRSQRLETLSNMTSPWRSSSSLLPLAISSSGTSPGEALTTGLACLWTGDFWRLAFVSVTTKGQPVGPLPFLPSDRRTVHAGQAACYHLATGGHQVLHLTYWLGISLLGLLLVKTFADLKWLEIHLFFMLTSSPYSGWFFLWSVYCRHWLPSGGQVSGHLLDVHARPSHSLDGTPHARPGLADHLA